MRMVITRNSIEIIPQGKQDEAFIEDTLGLREKGQSIELVRMAPVGLDSAIRCLEAKKKSKEE